MKSSSSRYALLDELRGLDLVSMMLYHACWDMMFLFGIWMDWYAGMPGRLWQQTICWVCILLSGFCVPLGHRTQKRGAQVFAAGALVTVVTLVFMPEDRVVFGVLTFLGSAMLLTGVLEPLLKKIPPAAALAVSAVLTCALVAFLIIYVMYKGLPNLSWELLTTEPSYLADKIGIYPDILNTIYIVLATLVVVLPLGVGAAIYLTEYAQNKKLEAVIEYAAETLSGIPSIIYGLVGMMFFCEFLGMGTCLKAGSLTLVIMNLPTIMRTTQESLKTVPQSYREGAFGLGAGKWRVIRTVVFPGCVDGIITGCILAVGRILGETAALLYTAGFAHDAYNLIDGLGESGATLTVALYVYAKEQGEFEVAFAIASILMMLALLINLSATLVGKYYKKRREV